MAYYSPAEWSCFLALGWGLPLRVLDLYVEFRNLTNGLDTVAGQGLVGALAHFGLDSIGSAEKQEMRELAMRGGPYTAQERGDLLDYCQSDVDALARLLPAMWSSIDLPRALLRGRYMTAVGRMEHTGVPIDANMLDTFRANWSEIKDRLIADIDADFGVFDGQTFKQDRFAGWLARNGIPWPRTESGRLALDDDTFVSKLVDTRPFRPYGSCDIACQSCGLKNWRLRVGRPQSLLVVSVCKQDRAKPTLKQQVHLRSLRLAQGTHQTAGRLGNRLR